MLPANNSRTQVYVTRFSEDTDEATLDVACQLRSAGVRTRLGLKTGKLGKQLKTAERLGIPWAVIVGPEEAAAEQIQLKNLATGEKWVLTTSEAAKRIL